MRLTLVDVKEGELTGCTTAILGTTAIDKEKHTHTRIAFSKVFGFPKNRRRRSGREENKQYPSGSSKAIVSN